MAKRKWKGTLSRDLLALGDRLNNKSFTFKKGQKVIVWKKRVYDENNFFTGKYEYHYSDENNRELVRMNKLYLEEFDKNGKPIN